MVCLLSLYGETLKSSLGVKLKPIRHLSQVFLKDSAPCKTVSLEFKKKAVSKVLEIGPGPGILTKELLDNDFDVVVVEKDLRFVSYLKEQFSEFVDKGKLTIYHCSILNFDLTKYKFDAICGNIPYNLSTPIVKMCLMNINIIPFAILLVQLEFGERIAAQPGTKAYGRLTVFSKLQADSLLLEVVDRSKFDPIPKVDSALVSIRLKDDPIDAVLLSKVEKVTREAFSQRRKKISNSLKKIIDHDELEKLGISVESRSEDLSPSDFVRIAKLIS